MFNCFFFIFPATQTLSNELRFVQLPIAEDQVCLDVYSFYFNPTNVCVSGHRGSSCNGDSGGGMHLSIGGVQTIIGIVSYGSSTCEGGLPVVMTRVTSYLDWISTNTGIRLL
jgi:secreted trypsin-like serine protease